MSHATTASLQLSPRAHWRVGDVVVGRRNAGWTTSKSGHSCPCQNCSYGLPAEKTGRGSLLNRPLRLPDDPVGQGTERNGTKSSCSSPPPPFLVVVVVVVNICKSFKIVLVVFTRLRMPISAPPLSLDFSGVALETDPSLWSD